MTGLGNKLLGIMNLKPASEVDTATRAMGQVEELIDVVSRAAEGDVPQEIPVSGDDAIGNLAGGLQTIFEELAAKKERLRDFEGQLTALSKSQAVIEFELDGTIIAANENFLATLGYSLEEVQGKHHRIFVDPAYANSHEYQQFWREIGSGDFKAGEFQRFAKDGRSVWIQASYNPIFDAEGKPYKVVKYASDITAAKLETTGNESQLEALGKSQAVIEFELDGTIITANENFQNAVGYNLSEIQGKHHRIFVDPTYGASAEYRQFWQDLAQGEFKAGEFERFTKDGSSVWIQASYNPIFDPNGKPYKVVKYASDITAARIKAADHEGQLQAINKSQAVIEFDLQGNIQTANENFLATVGYSLNEIQGKHHRIFVDPTYAASPEYAQFWRELGDGEFQSGEFQRFGKGGEEVWIQASYNSIFDPNGKPYKVVKYASDITPQKTAEREMKRVQAMIKQATAMVFADADHVIRYMNPAAEKALQALEQHLPVRASEIVGQSIDIFHKDPSHQRRILGNSANLPLTTQIKVGPETLALDVKPVFDEDGNNLGTMVTWELVTEKLAMEQQIKDKAEEDRQEAERVRGQVEHILDVVQRVADGDASAEITVTGDDAIGSLADGLRKFFEEKRLADKEKQKRADLERQQAETTALKVKQVLELVNAMADGRFNLQFPDLGDDAIGQVNSALEKAATSMRDALVEVREVSNTVATASNEMTSASDEITKGAQQQAARLEETAASLEEITSTVKQNSDNAQEARALATSSRDIATDGGQVVGDAVQAMREINDSSKQISDIITTIDEIAFQTNLLALNAAVEAARAGEQGRGFAVVASEVRNLAQRSASSAKEIKSLIQDSAGKVEKGTELVNKSGETLGEIVDSVKRVTDIVSEIAAASQEQLTAIEQLNQAVTQMDQVTQGNANQTEELSGTSNSVLNHAKRLDEMVSAFQLGTTGTTSHTSQTVAMPPASAPSFDEVEDDGDDFMDF